jgi:hypothetical protein
MHRSVIEAYPEPAWVDETHRNRSWNLSYHALFYTHLYASRSEEAFAPWGKGRPNLQYMGRLPYPPHTDFELGTPYAKAEMVEYATLVERTLMQTLPGEDLGAESGFDWLPFRRFELHLYNLRHLQHHTGQLSDRLQSATGAGVRWVGQVT